MAGVVDWRYDHTTEPWLRKALMIGAGVVFGAYTVFLGLALSAIALVLVEGSLGLRLLVVLLSLVGGPFSLLYLLPLARDRDQWPQFGPSGREPLLSIRGKALLGMAGGLVLGGCLLVDPRLAGGVFLAGLAAGVTGTVCSSRGTLDPETGTLNGRYREWDLTGVSGYRTLKIGAVVFIRLRDSGPGSHARVPTVLVLPRRVEAQFTAALETIISSHESPDCRDPNPVVRVVASLLAVASVAASAAAVLLGGFGHLSIYGASMGLLFAGLFVVVAREG